MADDVISGVYGSTGKVLSNRVEAQLSTLEPWTRHLAEEWLRYLQQYGVSYQITSTRRTFLEQLRLYRDWVTGKSKFPAAFPGRSRHENGTALDVVFHNVRAEDAAELAPYFWLKWGGQRDPVHFELDCAALDEQPSFFTTYRECHENPFIG